MGSDLSPLCLMRIKRDLKALHSDPPPGIFVSPDESNIKVVHALVVGPAGTPYENGFFYFIIGFPIDYPILPPMVKLMTTGGGTVRFNPNLYKDGKVCLSTLGTWFGPAWSPANSLTSVLLSIQSLLNEAPYHNEPGFEKERTAGDVKRYNDVIRHETLRVAVLGMLENDFRVTLPPALVDSMHKHFLEHYEFYVRTAEDNAPLNMENMQDPFDSNHGKFNYNRVLTRLKATYSNLIKRTSLDKTSNHQPVSVVKSSGDSSMS